MSAFQTFEIEHYNMLTGTSDFRADLIAGLESDPKAIPPKYLYDKHGSELFDLECRQPEYYVPDCEDEIYGYFSTEIARALGAGSLLIEPGSGASKKAAALLDSIEQPAGYVAVDISTEFMREAVGSLAQRFPALPMACISADFFHLDRLPEPVERMSDNRTIFFPGSTIGNLTAGEARQLLSTFGNLAGPSGKVLVGVDLRKSREILERAYRDSAQIADRLHLNLLRRANREAGADFDMLKFRYECFYNEEKGRMEMYVVSMATQVVTIDGRRFPLANNERIHTQYSHKYTPEQFQALAEEAGLRPVGLWMDSRQYFSVHLLEV